MEDRILHSADLAPLLVGDSADGLVLQQSVQTSANDPVARSSEIVFVDLSVPDASVLLADLQAQRDAGRAIEIFTIAADQDGLALVTDTLASRKDISAVHLLAHGSDGVMQLGQSRLDASTLLARADMVAAWGGALAADADLLLYGCDFAQTGVGQQLVRDLAVLTGADVAASTDTTGAASLGGNWTLEYGTGRIESMAALSAAGQLAWDGSLAVAFNSESSSGTTSATTSFNFEHTVNSGSDRLLLVSLVLGNGTSNATAVNFSGQSMTFVSAQNSPTNNVRVELWSLVAPTIRDGTVSVALSSASTLVAGATSYSGVDQTIPMAAAVQGSGNGAIASVDVSASVGDLVVDIVGARQVASFAVGANQTQNFVQTQGTEAAAVSAISTREAGALSVTMSNGFTSTDGNWASVAVRINQVTLLANAPFGTSGDLSGSGTGTGWAGNWSGGGTSIQLNNSNLSDPAGLLPTSGGSAQLQIASLPFSSSVTATRDLSTAVGADGTTTWISFLLQPDRGGAGNYAGIEFGSGSAMIGFAGFDGNQFVLGIAGGASTAVSGITPTTGQNVLLVLKLEHQTGSDTLTLYVNPTPGLDSPGAALNASASFNLDTLSRIAFTGGTGILSTNTSRIDEIRVGTTYASVAPTAVPLITSNGGGATASVGVAENIHNVTTVTASDYNSTSLTYSISGGDDAALFEINSSSGLLRFGDAPNFEVPLDAGANNVYDLIVRVSDGTFSDTQAIAVTVTDVSNGPITVTTTSDTYDGDVSSIEALIANRGGDGHISLREAITAANNSVGADTIVFGVDGMFLLPSIAETGDDNNVKGDLDIKGSLTIIGNGSGATIISGFGTDRVFDVRSGTTTLAMSGLTIRGGAAEDGGAMRIDFAVTVTLTDVVISDNNGENGGAIYNGGNLTITDGLLSGNTAVGNDGGAIYNTGTLSLTRVELSGNTASVSNTASGGNAGGAIYNRGIATLTEVRAFGNSAAQGGALWVSGSGNRFTLDRVTLSGNTATNEGGAIFGGSGALLTGVNMTISGNNATNLGGAIYLDAGNWSLSSSTIVYNNAGIDGGAFYTNNPLSLTLKSSILAFNTRGGSTANDSNAAQTSNGYNIALGVANTTWINTTSDRTTTAALLSLDPTLSANGGYGKTHALMAGSSAIDFGDPSAVATDQRGIARVGTPDIGAYENNAGNTPPTITPISNQSVDEDFTLGPLPFTIGDDAGPGSLIVSATSSNAALVTNANIVLGGSDANRTITLTPTANANSLQNGGTATIRITVSDGTNTTFRDFVLTVNPVADDPVAMNDIASTPIGGEVVVAVLGNDLDVDNQSFAIDQANVTLTAGAGTLVVTGTTIAFTPSSSTQATISYRIQDSGGAFSNFATLTINVGANNPPTAANGSVAVNEDASVAISVLHLGYGDPDAHPFAALRIDSLPAAGSLWFKGELVTVAGLVVSAVDLGNNTLVFVPAANGNGAAYASMLFSVQDNQGAFSASSNTLTFNVAAQPDPPTALDDVASTPINVEVDVNVLANDSHPDGLTLSITNATLDDPSLGSVSISTASDPRGTVVFTPALNVSGEVMIRYTVTDSASAASIGTLRITVGDNTVPTSANATVATAEDVNYTLKTADIAYADPDALQSFAALRIDNWPMAGELLIDGVVAQAGDSVTKAQLELNLLVYRPAGNGNGVGYDSFRFSVVDSAGARSSSYTLTVDVSPVNDAPMASGSATLAAINEDVIVPPGATVGSLFAGNFSDPADAGNVSQNQLAGVAVTGQTVDLAQGRWQYSINNGLSWQNIGSVSDNNALTLGTGDLLRFLAAINFAGAPNDLTVRLIDNSTTVTSGASNVSVATNGGTSAFSAQTVNLATSVNNFNDAPTITTPASGTISVSEDAASAITGISFNDVDGGITAIFTATFGVASGSLSATTTALVTVSGSSTALVLSGTLLNLNLFLTAGGLKYTTALDATANVTLNILIDDGGSTGTDPGFSGTATSEAASASVNLVVSAVNDPPAVSAGSPISVIEDTASPLSGIVFSDVDAGTGVVTTSFSVLSGALSASAGSGVGVGGNASTLALTGSIADINNFIAAGRLMFTTAFGATADVHLAITINDGGNSGAGMALNGSGSRTLQVSALNKAPTIAAPAAFNMVEDVPGVISGISFTDPDAGTTSVTVRFAVDSGSLSAGTDGALGITGSGTDRLTLMGSVANINSFIAAGKLMFTTATDATANASLLSSIDDGGNSGVGGARTASTSSLITVTPVNDAPALAIAMADRDTLSGNPLLFQLPATHFVDPDAGDSLQYSATLASGAALPPWLHFDPQTRAFSGTPSDTDAGSLVIRVVASDTAEASAQGQFVIFVTLAQVDTVDAGSSQVTPSTPPKDEESTEKPVAPATEPVATAAATPTAVPVDDGADIADTVLSNTPGVGIDTNVQIVPPRPTLFFDMATTTPVAQGDTVLAQALTAQFNQLSSSESSQLFSNDDLLRKLEELRRQMEQPGQNQQIMTASSIALTSGLSIGYVIWLVRGGILVSSMLSALPAWQMIDPLPVLATSGRGPRKEGLDTDEPGGVDALFDDKSAPAQVAPVPAAVPAQSLSDIHKNTQDTAIP